MSIFFGFVIACLALFLGHSLYFSRASFWEGLERVYRCSTSEFKCVKSMKGRDGRFVYCLNGKWNSSDYIDVKMDLEYIYIGVEFPLECFIKPIKILKSELVPDGHKRYWWHKRCVFKIKDFDSSLRKIALLPNKNNRGQTTTRTTEQ